MQNGENGETVPSKKAAPKSKLKSRVKSSSRKEADPDAMTCHMPQQAFPWDPAINSLCWL